MITEYHSADVCCECVDHLHGSLGHFSNPVTFTGKNKREIDRQRRADGWVKVKGQDICPECKGRKPIRLEEIVVK